MVEEGVNGVKQIRDGHAALDACIVAEACNGPRRPHGVAVTNGEERSGSQLLRR